MKVAYICNEYPPFKNGGIGTYTKDMAEHLAQLGHEVSVIGVFPENSIDEIETQNGVRLIRLAPSRVGALGDRINLYRNVLKLEREHGLDLLEAQEYGGLLAGWPKNRFKTIIRLHGSILYFNLELQERTWKNHIWKRLEGATLNRAHRIVSVSHYTAARTRQIFRLDRKIDVIHNGVPLSGKTTPIQDVGSCFRVIFAGSLQQKKGFLQLLHAWKIVLEGAGNFELHIAGKDNSNQFGEIKEILGNTGSVTYHGVLSKPALENLYLRMNLAVFPSFAEAFSLAPMEAMAVGLPVVYTQLSSGAELIEHGVTGLLVNPHRPEDIARVIRVAADLSPQERMELGERGRRHIEKHFSIERLAKKNETLMRNLVLGGDCLQDH